MSRRLSLLAICPQQEGAALCAPPMRDMELPCLDLADWRAGGTSRAAFVAGLQSACTRPQSGFFYLRVGAAIPSELADGALRAAAQFFELPLERKLEIDLHESPHYRGFAQLGTETTAATTDLREYVELGDELVASTSGRAESEPLPPYLRMGIGPNQWPRAPPQFKTAMTEYFTACRAVADEVMMGVSAALDLAPEELARTYCPAPLGAHVRYKPACYRSRAYAGGANVRVEDLSQGLGPHKDFGFLSLLLQNEVPGLQVQRASDGVWLSAPPIEGTLVVNLGEMAELVSDGAFVASTHRVLPPPPGGCARVSIPVFYNPSLDSAVSPVKLSARLRKFADLRGASDAVQMDGTSDNKIVPSYGDNWVKGFARSQPAWFARHLPDVFARQQELQPTAVGRVVARIAAVTSGDAQAGSKL